MAKRIHANEILDGIAALCKLHLETPLSLQAIIRGSIEWFPNQSLLPLVNGIFLHLEPAIEVTRVQMPKDLQFLYAVRLVYVRRNAENEDINRKKIDEITLIAETIIDNYNLPDVSLENGQILWCFPRNIETEPPEDFIAADVAADLSAVAFNLEVVVRTNHRL